MDIYKFTASKFGTQQIQTCLGLLCLKYAWKSIGLQDLHFFLCRLALLIEFSFAVPEEEASYILIASREYFEKYVRIVCAAMFDKNSGTQYAFKTKNV